MARDQITVHIDVTGLRQAFARLTEELGRAVADCCSLGIDLDTFREEAAAEEPSGYLVPSEIQAELMRRMEEDMDIEIFGVPGAPEPAGLINAGHVNARCAGPDRHSESRQAADERARELLMSCLDDGQKKTFQKDGWFDVRAQDGKLYRIHASSSMNVYQVGKHSRYCAQFRDIRTGYIPIYDQMLAQKMCLETDVKHFLAVANKTGPRPPSDGAGLPHIEISMDDFSWVP